MAEAPGPENPPHDYSCEMSCLTGPPRARKGLESTHGNPAIAILVPVAAPWLYGSDGTRAARYGPMVSRMWPPRSHASTHGIRDGAMVDMWGCCHSPVAPWYMTGAVQRLSFILSSPWAGDDTMGGVVGMVQALAP